GSTLSTPQEFIFDTNDAFEDPIPTEPPRATGFVARNTVTGEEIDLARLDPRPGELSKLTNQELIDQGRFIEPGAGGPPNFATPWSFELIVSEPLDPNTIITDNIELIELFGNATDSGVDAPPAVNDPTAQDVEGFGTPTGFKVPINVTVSQSVHPEDGILVRIQVTPLFTLVDNARYQLNFSGNILGIDFSKTFIGDNGLTGDGQTQLAVAFPEPGGQGYTTEFIVRDRPSIATVRTLDYDPVIDGINPETGDTSLDPNFFNRALYDAPGLPSLAVGRVGAFGSGALGELRITTGVFQLDTGDTPNELAGNPFSVTDLDPGDVYKNFSPPPASGARGFDPSLPTEFDFESIVIELGATLQIIGVNAARVLSSGVVEVHGT
ncbi:MAG: hypothetical protein R3344_14920, partial [Acidobacteriota bacterium]|nr:hypothetical protein [Acidobacteriota bacterium]